MSAMGGKAWSRIQPGSWAGGGGEPVGAAPEEGGGVSQQRARSWTRDSLQSQVPGFSQAHGEAAAWLLGWVLEVEGGLAHTA